MTRKAGKLGQRKPRLVPHDEVYAKWRKDADFQLARAELADEFALVAELIRARTKAGLTQSQVADRMQSTQPAIARLESGGRVPSTRTLQRYARATGHRLRITLVPEGTKAR
jgi:ribosome-binding protein aMBF1 (putative translation factor)